MITPQESDRTVKKKLFHRLLKEAKEIQYSTFFSNIVKKLSDTMTLSFENIL